MLPCQEYVAVPRVCCRAKSMLPCQEYVAVPRVCCRAKSMLPCQEYVAVPRVCCRAKSMFPILLVITAYNRVVLVSLMNQIQFSFLQMRVMCTAFRCV